jgi:hypothetical protein
MSPHLLAWAWVSLSPQADGFLEDAYDTFARHKLGPHRAPRCSDAVGERGGSTCLSQTITYLKLVLHGYSCDLCLLSIQLHCLTANLV